MKKSLIALAVLAASGATMAQSSVTLYGRADVGVGSEKVDGESSTKMINGGLTTSRWGLRGTEDLGGGLKAHFKFEQRLDLSTGEVQSPSFKGEASMGLMGGFGKLTLGRGYTVYDDARALSVSNSVFDSSFTPASNGVFKSGGDYSSRFNNKITYALPKLGGVYGGIEYALDEDATVDANMLGAKIGYKAGPLDVALGLQQEKGKDNDYMLIAAAYDLGAVSLSGGYNTRRGNDEKGDDNELTVGLNVPMGRLDGEGMRRLADLAERYGEGELRFTESQNVVIADVPIEGIDPLVAALSTPERQRAFRLNPGPLMAEAVSCTGNRYCSFALIPTKSTAQSVVEELEQRLELPHAIRTHWTGCPNACGQPYMGQIGLMGQKLQGVRPPGLDALLLGLVTQGHRANAAQAGHTVEQQKPAQGAGLHHAAFLCETADHGAGCP